MWFVKTLTAHSFYISLLTLHPTYQPPLGTSSNFYLFFCVLAFCRLSLFFCTPPLSSCQIDWHKGKDVTVKTIKKKQKHKGRGTVRTVTKQVPNDSFFNFFNPVKGENTLKTWWILWRCKCYILPSFTTCVCISHSSKYSNS